MFASSFSQARTHTPRLLRQLRGRGRDRGPALAGGAVEGRAVARRLRRREAARGRAVADRAQRKRRGHSRASGTAGRPISGSPRSPRRPPGHGRRSSRATARRPSAARSRARSSCAAAEPPRPRAVAGSVWPVRDAWDRATENLYSAWIEKLFDAPLDAAPSWKALHEVLRDRSRNVLFNHLGLREDQMGHRRSPRLRRPSLLPARLFRLQDGAAVRLREVHARRRRRGAAVPGVVEHPERGAAPHAAAGRHRRGREPPPDAQRSVRVLRPVRAAARTCGQADGTGAGRRHAGATPGAPPRSRRRTSAAAGGARAGVRALSATSSIGDGVHSGAGRTRLTDDNTDFYPVPLNQDDAAPGDRVRRSVRAPPGAGAARAADRRRGGRLPRGRRAARRDGRAQALLARQFPVRAGSRARRPRLQALPAGRARQGRRLAAADQRRDRQASAVRRFFARPGAARRSRPSTTAWTT